MQPTFSVWTRRRFLKGVTATAAAAAWSDFFLTPGAFAQELTRTPAQMEGPFYPDRLPLDTDNDLIIVNNSITPAVGLITHLSGRVLDSRGDPVRNATVEIWQVDNEGSYFHTQGANPNNGNRRDSHFQGFGRFMTGSSGEYYFRTIKPVPYPGRTPHIHFKVKIRGRQDFITQCYIRGEPRNNQDGVFRAISNAQQREAVLVDWVPTRAWRVSQYTARFDIVLGFTPAG